MYRYVSAESLLRVVANLVKCYMVHSGYVKLAGVRRKDAAGTLGEERTG